MRGENRYIFIHDEIVKSFTFSSCASRFTSQLPPPTSAFPQTRKNYALQAQHTCLHRFATENLFIMSYEMAFHRSILPHIVTCIFFPAFIVIFSLPGPSWRICDFVAILPKSWSVHDPTLLPWGWSFFFRSHVVFLLLYIGRYLMKHKIVIGI